MTAIAPTSESATPPAAQISIRRGCDKLRQTLLQEGLPAAAARVLSARDITCREDITPPLSSLPTPDILPNVEKLSELLSDAIRRKSPICVVGDYDADGMTSTALAVDCLTRLGAEVTWRIPDRFRHGYGLHAEIAEEAAAAGSKLLLTVDNGVSAQTAVARAKELGLCVCITDHHLPASDTLPAADCIVNPQCAPAPRLGGNLAGVGVAFYAMAALRKHMQADIDMSDYLDLLTIGTIADCVPMDKLNRTLVSGGLARLRKGRVRAGVLALLNSTKISPAALNCRDISYKIAPRINSAGRFQRAELSVELLLASDQSTAKKLATELESINKKRVKEVQEVMETLLIESPPPAIVVAEKSCRLGITGIIAGRLAEKHNRPTVVFGWSGEYWRGSGRVPAGDWDLHALALAAAKTAGDSVLRVGGHHKAIGISVRTTEEFEQAFIEHCRNVTLPPPVRLVDALPPPEELNKEAVACMEQMVWGEGFASPLFASTGDISNLRQLGNSCHWRFDWDVGGRRLQTLAFNQQTQPSKTINATFSLTTDSRTGALTAVIEELL